MNGGPVKTQLQPSPYPSLSLSLSPRLFPRPASIYSLFHLNSSRFLANSRISGFANPNRFEDHRRLSYRGLPKMDFRLSCILSNVLAILSRANRGIVQLRTTLMSKVTSELPEALRNPPCSREKRNPLSEITVKSV